MKAHNDYLMVEPIVETMTSSGIYMPETLSERTRWGHIRLSSCKDFPVGQKIFYDSLSRNSDLIKFILKDKEIKVEFIRKTQIIISE